MRVVPYLLAALLTVFVGCAAYHLRDASAEFIVSSFIVVSVLFFVAYGICKLIDKVST